MIRGQDRNVVSEKKYSPCVLRVKRHQNLVGHDVPAGPSPDKYMAPWSGQSHAVAESLQSRVLMGREIDDFQNALLLARSPAPEINENQGRDARATVSLEVPSISDSKRHSKSVSVSHWRQWAM